MKVKFIRLPSSSLRKRTTLKRFPAVVGRSLEADVYVDDRWASRSHCELSISEDTLVVRDLQSRNGTFVNSERIETSRLQPGDELIVGRVVFRIELSHQKSLLDRMRWHTEAAADNNYASHADMADSIIR